MLNKLMVPTPGCRFSNALTGSRYCLSWGVVGIMITPYLFVDQLDSFLNDFGKFA